MANNPFEGPPITRKSIRPSFASVFDVSPRQKERNEKEQQHQQTINIDEIISSKPCVRVDSDLFDCPICFQLLRPPVVSAAVAISYAKRAARTPNKKCPSCSLPIGSNRCITFEKLLESSAVSCVYKQYGCVEELSYLNKTKHENACEYIPIACPERGCEFIGGSNCLYTHFAEKHSSSSQPFTFNRTKRVNVILDEVHRLLQETNERILFVLHRVVDPLGSFLNVTCVAQPTVSDMNFSFELTAVRGRSIISLKSAVELTPECFTQPDKEKCLLIRNEFHDIEDGLSVNLVIRRESLFEETSNLMSFGERLFG